MLSVSKRLFLILFVLGLIGVLSFLFVDLSALVALFPVAPGEQAPNITPAIKLLSVIQPTILVAVAVLVGVVLAPRVGLASPYLESIAAGHPSPSTLRAQLAPAVLGAVAGSVCILVTAAVVRQFVTAEVNDRLGIFGKLLPLPTRLLYGGIVEELLLRWGFMTLLVWVGWRLFQRKRNRPASITFVVAILLSSLVFALAHLPVAIMLLGEANAAIVFFVVVANSAFGIVAGYLYWKYGLESAIIAHMLVHVVLVVASSVGAYF